MSMNEKLTKEQLEFMGFKVEIKKLKKSTKIEIWHPYYDEIDTFYEFPSFCYIVNSIIKNTTINTENDMKKRFVERFLD